MRRNNGKQVCRQEGNQPLCMVEDDACAGSTIFRSDNQEIQAGNCDCASNRQCERRVGKGAKCIQVGEDCSGACPSGTTSGCMAPCADLNPPA